ncbi:hypothetical protein [Streptomyces sp. NPDC002676]
MTSENTENPVNTEVADPAPEVPAPRRRLRPRRLAAVAGGAALVLVTVAGVGYTAVTVNGADRSPGAPGWRLPKAAKGKPVAEKATGLRAMLLPYGEDQYGRGPDIAEFGSDAELSGRQATDLRKQSLRNLPRSQRRLMEREIDKNPVRGLAMRSYVSTAHAAGSILYAEEAFTVEIALSQMANERTLHSSVAAQHRLFDAMKGVRKGPEIEGHKNAACFLPPAESGQSLDTMTCSGYVGDVLVVATVAAAKPLDKKGAAEMIRAQFDRIKDPGKAV